MLKTIAFAFLAAFLGSEAATAQTIILTSPDIAPGARIADEQVFKGFGCTGGNISPALSWSGAPAGTKSFALSVYDPDAPTGSGFWHWVVFNIPPDGEKPCQERGRSERAQPRRRGRCRAGLILACLATAVRVLPKGTRRTTITSRSSPWIRRSSTETRTTARPWSASCFTSTRSPRRS